MLDAGAATADLSFGNTIKKARHRRRPPPRHHPLRRRLAPSSTRSSPRPGADVCVRLFHDGGGADWPLSRKFGCDHHDALELVTVAARNGHRPGVSFHVGSQQRSTAAWTTPWPP